MEQNVTLDRAIQIAAELCRPNGAAPKRLLSSAYGEIAAESINATQNVPPFNRSPFDGYAFIAADSGSAPVTLRIIGEITAGSSARFEVVSGTAVKILTGAPVPPGADVIVKFEETEFTADSVTLLQEYAPSNIVPAGEDVREGETILRRGERIDAATAGMLAAQGNERVRTFRRPLVGIISTGNELSGQPGAGKIFDSNRHSLSAGVEALAAQAKFLGTSGDSADGIRKLVESEPCGMLISTGGMGKSDRDFTLAAFEALGARTVVRNGSFMPGGTFALCDLGGVPCFLLSGNPAAAMVTFYALIQPSIRKMSGLTDYRNPDIRAILPEGYAKSAPRTRLLTAKLTYGSGVPELHVTERGKGTISALKGIDAIAVVPPSEAPIEPGSILEAFLVQAT